MPLREGHSFTHSIYDSEVVKASGKTREACDPLTARDGLLDRFPVDVLENEVARDARVVRDEAHTIGEETHAAKGHGSMFWPGFPMFSGMRAAKGIRLERGSTASVLRRKQSEIKEVRLGRI